MFRTVASLAVLSLMLFYQHGSTQEDTITVRGDLNVTGGIHGVGAVPIGAIIDWWRPTGSSDPIPPGFQICDGSVVNDPGSPFNGKNVPDLNEIFVRGTSSLSSIGETGGSNELELGGETELAGNHQHDLSGRTSWISFYDNSEGATSFYYTRDENRGWGCNAPDCNPKVQIRADVDGKNEGQHRHDLTGLGTAENVVGHQHGLSGSYDNQPSYYGLLKIIRIK